MEFVSTNIVSLYFFHSFFFESMRTVWRKIWCLIQICKSIPAIRILYLKKCWISSLHLYKIIHELDKRCSNYHAKYIANMRELLVRKEEVYIKFESIWDWFNFYFRLLNHISIRSLKNFNSILMYIGIIKIFFTDNLYYWANWKCLHTIEHLITKSQNTDLRSRNPIFIYTTTSNLNENSPNII